MNTKSGELPLNLHEFIQSSVWIYAKTMPKWPHEYIVRGKVNENLFEQLIQHIRLYGYKGNFYEKRITYYEHTGMVYWTMGAPIDDTKIINRCKKEDSFEYRFKYEGVPD